MSRCLSAHARFLMSDEAAGISKNTSLPERLLIGELDSFTVFYAPFESVNESARVVICGITPGLQQAANALTEARRLLLRGMDADAASCQAKAVASFSGEMREALVLLMNEVGLNDWLEIESCAELFADRAELVHCTSALRFPVFVGGKNYSGSPKILSSAFLRNQLEFGLGEEVALLPKNCAYVPLGDTPASALKFLADNGLIRHEQILDGLPHPSPANRERIAYFLGEKPKEKLSSRTNHKILDARKASIIEKIRNL